MTSSMSHGNRWWRASSKLSLSTRFVCARTSFWTNFWWRLFLLFEWIHPSIDQQCSQSKLIEEVSSFRGWKHHEHHPLPRHQNNDVHTMLSVEFDKVNVMEILTHVKHTRTSRDYRGVLKYLSWVQRFRGTHDCEYKYSWLWVQRGHSTHQT